MDDLARVTGKRYTFAEWVKSNAKNDSFLYRYPQVSMQLTIISSLDEDAVFDVLAKYSGLEVAEAKSYYDGASDLQAAPEACAYCHAALSVAGSPFCAGCMLWAKYANKTDQAQATNMYQLVSWGRNNRQYEAAEAAQKRLDAREARAKANLRRVARIAHSKNTRRIPVRYEYDCDAEKHADDYDQWAQSYATSAEDLQHGNFNN